MSAFKKHISSLLYFYILLPLLVHPITLWNRYYFPYFIGENPKVRRLTTFETMPSYSGVELGYYASRADFKPDTLFLSFLRFSSCSFIALGFRRYFVGQGKLNLCCSPGPQFNQSTYLFLFYIYRAPH